MNKSVEFLRAVTLAWKLKTDRISPDRIISDPYSIYIWKLNMNILYLNICTYKFEYGYMILNFNYLNGIYVPYSLV